MLYQAILTFEMTSEIMLTQIVMHNVNNTCQVLFKVKHSM